jgi:DNA-directed RNA polymerase subunit beta'
VTLVALGRFALEEREPRNADPFVREQADKGKLSQIVNKLAEEYPKVEVAASLDRIKDAGFYWATRSGVLICS